MTDLTIRSLAWLSTLQDRLEEEDGALSIELVGVVIVLGTLVFALITASTGWGSQLTTIVGNWISAMGG